MTELPVPPETVGDTEARRLSASWRSLRQLATIGLLVSMMGVALPAASSWATPVQIPAQPEPQASCSYRLDPPRRTDLSFGVAAVTTTMATTGCQGEAQPVDVTACIRADDLGTQCRTGSAWNSAELNFRPWRPGVTYTAMGTGCALVGNPVSRVCTSMGPFSVGL